MCITKTVIFEDALDDVVGDNIGTDSRLREERLGFGEEAIVDERVEEEVEGLDGGDVREPKRRRASLGRWARP